MQTIYHLSHIPWKQQQLQPQPTRQPEKKRKHIRVGVNVYTRQASSVRARPE